MEALIASSGKGVYPDYIGTGENLGLPDKLAYLVSYGELFVAVISKKRESPKLIINNLTSILGEGSPICHLGASQLHADQLPTILARDFGLDQNRTVSLQALSDFSKGLRDQGHRPVVIVNDAGRIKERALRALFSIAEKCQLGLVIFASPSFLKKGLFKDFRSNIYICNLSVMNDVDLRSYIRRSYKEDLQASDAQLDEILHRAEGSTERIDGLIDELIESPRSRIGASAMHLSVLMVMFAVGIGFYGAENFQNKQEETLVLDIPALEIEPESKLVTEIKEVASTDSSSSIEAPAERVRAYVTTPELLNLPLIKEGGDSELLSSKVRPQEVIPTVPKVSKNNWILEAKPTDYTLQVMGSSSEERIQAFIDSQGESSAFTYYETSRGGQSWFVLTVGQYQNREEALAAISTLPPNIRAQVPWARHVASIRAVLLPE